MERVELLTVEGAFCLAGGKSDKPTTILVIRPDFSVPGGSWKDRKETVTIVRPDGHEFEAIAQISLSHVNIRDPNASIDQRWRVTILIADTTSDEVQVGSRILGSRETRDALLPSCRS